ncbi:methyltransferase [Rarobacter faecitabidus]
MRIAAPQYGTLEVMPDLPSAQLASWCSDRGLEPDPVDSLLLDEASVAASGPIAVLDDHTGALTPLVAELAHRIAAREGTSPPRIGAWQDSYTARQLVASELARARRSADAAEALAAAVSGAALVVGRLPKSLDRLEEYAATIATHAAPGVRVALAGRVKHMSLGMNEVLAGHFEVVSASRARQKSRVLFATTARGHGDRPRKPGGAFPRIARVTRRELGLAGAGGIDVAAHGGVFASTRIDIGTRVLLRHVGDAARIAAEGPNPAPRIVDLGCGTGLLALAASHAVAGARVLAADDSYLAVQSTQETARRAGMLAAHPDEAGVYPMWTSASALASALASDERAGTIDLILCNPPFHVGAGVDASPA